MKKLIALFAPALLATSFFIAPVSAGSNNQLERDQNASGGLGGGKYHQCFLEGDPGCQKKEGRKSN